MPSICAVTTCRNSLRKRKGDLHSYNFPRDETLRKTWIWLCSRSQYIENIKSRRVCSDHFKETDFENWMQFKMMGCKKLFLKKHAVPSQNLPCGKGSPSPQHSPELTDVKNDANTKYQEAELLYITNHEVQNEVNNEFIYSVCDNDETSSSSECIKSLDNLNAIELYYEGPREISKKITGSSKESDQLFEKSKEITLTKSTKMLILDKETDPNTYLTAEKCSAKCRDISENSDNAFTEIERKSLGNFGDKRGRHKPSLKHKQLIPNKKLLKTAGSDNVTKETSANFTRFTDNLNEVCEGRESIDTDSLDNSGVSKTEMISSIGSSKIRSDNSDGLSKNTSSEAASTKSAKCIENSNMVCREKQQIPASAPIKVLLLTTGPVNANNSGKVCKEMEQMKQKIAIMQKQINVLKKQNNNYAELRAENHKNKNTIKRLERKLKRAKENQEKNKCSLVDTEVRNVLSKMFTETQMKLLLEKQKRVYWSEEDMTIAFTILYSSKPCYIFLREKLHYPLPGLSTLRRWTQKIHTKKGSLDGVIKLLEVASELMSNLDKLVVLQYGKVKVAHKYEYDRENDEVIGPHKYMQVVIARSLYGKWKQPIFADFDKRIDTVLLNELFTKLDKIGIRVVACVSDGGLANARLWQVLDISWKKPWIYHPRLDKKKIFFFADTSHMFKLLRNWFLDAGFLLKDGVQITNRPLVELLSEDTETSSKCGITKKHIECLGLKREDISLAVELLSPSVAYALIASSNKDSDYDDLASFIDTVINWFDVMYSSSPTPTAQTETGYGRSGLKTFQDACLDKAFETILNMRCISQKNLISFQEGILFSIKSLQELFTGLKEEFDIRYISMDRLNLGALENLFSHLKSEGGVDPTPLHALNTLRKIVLGNKRVRSNGTETSTVQEEGEEYLLNKVLDGAGIEIFSSSESQCIDNKSDDELSEFPLMDKTQFERDSLQGWAERIAIKLQSSHPHLSTLIFETVDMKTKDNSYRIMTRIKPTQEFMQEIEELDSLFCKQMESRFVNVKNITKKIVTNISALSKTDKVIIQNFVEQRILTRINYLNMKLAENKLSIEKRKLDNQNIKLQLHKVVDKKRKPDNNPVPSKQLKQSTA